MEKPTPPRDIRINREGTWLYRGTEMLRREIVALFYQHLQSDSSGNYFIEMGKERCHVAVEDTAYVVLAVYRFNGGGGAEERLNLLLSDDSMESLDLCSLRIGKDNIPYCRVKNRRFDARFSRASYYQLAEHIKHDSLRGAYFIMLNGQPYYIACAESQDA